MGRRTTVAKSPKLPQAEVDWREDLLIGTRLKHARLNRRASLRQLANEIGCTESFLSKVENDKVRPSLTMLHKIVQSLDISIAKLFTETGEASSPVTVSPAGKRTMLATERTRLGKGITLESLLPVSLAVLLEANIHHVAPGGSSRGFIHHQGEEMGYVLEGEVELTVNGKTVRIKQGDSFFFFSNLPHGYRNLGTVAARILWVNTPPSF